MNKKTLLVVVLLLILFGVLGRIFPHAPNLTPIVALAFISSLYLEKKYLPLILPIGAVAISDLFIGLYDWRIMASVYASFALVGILSLIVQKHRNFLGIGITLIASSLLFFLITNGAVWLFSPWYEKSIAGLFYAYELGLPFLRNMFVGDLLYTTGLIIVFEFVYALRIFLINQSEKSKLDFSN